MSTTVIVLLMKNNNNNTNTRTKRVNKLIKKEEKKITPTFLLVLPPTPHLSPSPPAKSPVTLRWNLAESNTLANITADQFTADHSLRLAMNLLTGESRLAGKQVGRQARGIAGEQAGKQAGQIGKQVR